MDHQRCRKASCAETSKYRMPIHRTTICKKKKNPPTDPALIRVTRHMSRRTKLLGSLRTNKGNNNSLKYRSALPWFFQIVYASWAAWQHQYRNGRTAVCKRSVRVLCVGWKQEEKKSSNYIDFQGMMRGSDSVPQIDH